MKQKMEGFYGIISLGVVLLTQTFDVLLFIASLLLLIFTFLQFSKH